MWVVLECEGSPGSCAGAIPLPEGDFVIGRSRDCQLVLTGRRVSRTHVILRRAGGKVTLALTEDAIDTFVNGEPARDGPIAPGDRLTVGNAMIRIEAEPPAAERRISRLPDLADREAGVSGGRPPASPEEWQALGAFLDTLRSAVAPRVLLKRLLLGLVDVFQAERGFVLLRERQGSKLVPVASHEIADMDEFVAISSTVYAQAIDGGCTVFIANSFEDALCANARSVAQALLPRTIVCGPLSAGGKVFGVIYLDMPVSASAGDPARIKLFESVTGLVSQLLAASQTRNNLLAARGRIEALNTVFWERQQLILGPSEASRELDDLIEAGASQDVSVLLTGETGTGKEMVARAIHRRSQRREGPFVPVNCAALPRDLIEAELFGAEKGAYTGAEERRIGRFELASSGTLFLDEIGELPLDLQVKLLRVLQERVIMRLGGDGAIPVDFRLICATNADLEEAVRANTFRGDIYYRINVFRIRLRPLRERLDDILVLARHFLEDFGAKFKRTLSGFAPEAESLIKAYPWPGNIRELRNAVERAVVVEKTDVVRPESLPIAAASPGAASHGELERSFWDKLPDDYETAREVFERTFLKRMIGRFQGNVTAAAKAAGMPRSTVYRRLRKLGLLEGEEPAPVE